MINRTSKEQLIAAATAARQQNDIKHFLKPYFSFRLYVQFKDKTNKRHFYGNEHQCTFNQLKFAQVPHIELSRIKGYTDLINLVEVVWKAKTKTAAIYMRPEGSQSFDILCRRYYLGEIQQLNDPLLDDTNDARLLYYYFQANQLFITETNPANIDFKNEINHALNNPGTTAGI
jgi:hypothetical protein